MLTVSGDGAQRLTGSPEHNIDLLVLNGNGSDLLRRGEGRVKIAGVEKLVRTIC
jgi:hypothetical protein